MFEDALGRYLMEIARLRRTGASEASIRDAFLRFLREAFPRLEEASPFDLERYIPALRTRGGFADAIYGDLIFEFKRRLDEASVKMGKDELTRYLLNRPQPERFFGILTDGETMEVYALREGRLERVDGLRLDAQRASECRLWLERYLFHDRSIVPTAEDLALRFGEDGPTFRGALRILRDAWQRKRSDPSAQTRLAEWQSLLAIVYGSPVGDEDLFLRHTYLALLARILAFAALTRRAPSTSEIPNLLTGEAFSAMGLDNFVTDDFFAWGTGDPAVTDLAGSLAARLTATYNLDRWDQDLLKGLYERLVDPQTRHDLGEFYTPDWLAELTLRRAGFPSDSASLLDPACGSGTFLVTAIRLLRESGRSGADLVRFCVSNLAGIDVHPLAVAIARTNFVLALGNDLRGYSERIFVPIYMADALNLPGGLGRFLTVPVDLQALTGMANKKPDPNLPEVFCLPPETDPDRLHRAIDDLVGYADPSLPEASARAGFRKRLAVLGIPDEQWGVWLNNLRLMRWLLKPPATDTVWRFVLQNAYRPALLAHRRFDFVVGNPPWLAYRFIRRPDYQKRVKGLVLKHELLSRRDGNLFPHMELATLFFAFCAEHYLARGGTLAFVMPRSVLTGAKQHAEFRRKFVSTARLIIDCEGVAPLFNVPACVIVWTGAQGTRSGSVPLLRLSGGLPTRNVSWPQAQKALRQSVGTFTPPAAPRPGPYLQRVTQGASIVPRCLWFVRPNPNAMVIDHRCPQLVTDPRVAPQAKPPWKGISMGGEVEAEFLFATLLSDDLLPFGWRRLSLVVLPLAAGGLISAADAAREGRPGLADWLKKADNLWQSHRESEDLLAYIDWQGKLTSQRPSGVYKVIYNAGGTHLCACVVDARDVGGLQVHGLPVRGFVADTKTYRLETPNEDEAYYLSAVLNAPCVDELIKPYQTKGAFGAQSGKGERDIHRRPFEVLPIPPFDRSDTRHRQLAQLGRDCHAKVARWTACISPDMLSKQPIGRLRKQVRQLLTRELTQIDSIVRTII